MSGSPPLKWEHMTTHEKHRIIRPQIVEFLRENHNADVPLLPSDIARKFGVHHSYVLEIKRWLHLPAHVPAGKFDAELVKAVRLERPVSDIRAAVAHIHEERRNRRGVGIPSGPKPQPRSAQLWIVRAVEHYSALGLKHCANYYRYLADQYENEEGEVD